MNLDSIRRIELGVLFEENGNVVTRASVERRFSPTVRPWVVLGCKIVVEGGFIDDSSLQ